MPAPPIPSWKERLAACFRFRHRLLHVFGVPAAAGAAVAVGAASALNADVGMSLGMLAAGMGSLIAGYYVTAGFDRKLVAQLQAEHVEAVVERDAREIERIVETAHPEVKLLIERVVAVHASIEAVFTDGIDDAVERILDSSRADLRALRDRAASLVELYHRLGEVLQQTDGRRLYDELSRLKQELGRLQDGPARNAQEQALASADRAYTQWRAAYERQSQIKSTLVVIEKNLEEFKLAMALRKADAVDGNDSAAVDVSELQQRLAAAGQACDELVGRPSSTPQVPRQRARRVQ